MRIDLPTQKIDTGLQALPGEARAYHTATLVDNKIYILGGSNGQAVLGDVHVLDTDSRSWKTVDFGCATPLW